MKPPRSLLACVPVTAAMAAVAAVPAAAGGRSGVRDCAGPRAMLIEKVGSIEIFRPRPRTKLFACAAGYRPRELHPGDCGITTFCRFFPAYLIAGPYVFYAEQISNRGESLFTDISRVDPRTGSEHDKTWGAGGPDVQMIPTSEDRSGLADLVARADGSAAWIYKNAQVSPATFEVHREDATGVALIASSPTITPGSLGLAGSTFYWTSGGVPASSTLTAPRKHA